MRIGVKVDRDDFFYDIHSLVRSFYPEDEVILFAQDDAVKGSEDYDLIFPVHLEPYTDRVAEKNRLKKELYARLSGRTGRELPWGTLSGIRPTKIPVKLLGEGKDPEEIRRLMKETYLVSDRRIDLSLAIAQKERKILAGIGDGWSLYINIPFCPSICLYCTFSSSPIQKWEGEIGQYLEALFRELEAISDIMKGKTLHTIYIGGGTPTSLCEEDLEKLLKKVDTLFPSESVLEYTVEAGRPDSITEGKLKILRDHPVTRISVNPQTMNDETLRLIGRGHTREDTLCAFSAARRAGFDNINMDMILGLPDEGPGEVRFTLEEIKKLRPDSLTVHSLAVKRASRLAVKKEDYRGFSFQNSLQIMDEASQAAEETGLSPYYLYRQKNMKGCLENTGYALEGKEGIYNILIMEEVESIYAAGAGASTKFVSSEGRIERAVNPKDIHTYLSRIDEFIEKKRNGAKWTVSGTIRPEAISLTTI